LREKRQHHRAILQVPVRVTPKDGEPWETTSVDISLGGMLLEGESPVALGTEVSLSLALPKLGQVEMPGFVRWASERGFGVQFGLIGPRETHTIGGLVRNHRT
jgi:c-di-GMP-binding flagellar brake protein YcgR